MALQVNTNMGALLASAAASSVNKSQETSMERLSTGLRINSAADDAAGMAIASRLTSEIRGTNQAIRNAMDGQALIDTAEGAQSEIENLLQRMREIAVQGANDTNSSVDRTALQDEMTQLTREIDRIAATTTWSGTSLLNGDGSDGSIASTADSTNTFNFQISTNTAGTGDTLAVAIQAVDATSLGVGGTSGDVSIGTITESNTTSNTPDIANVTSGTNMTLTADSNVLTVGTYTAGETLSVDIEGTTVSITEATATTGYLASTDGVASQLAQAIEDAGIDGISVSVSGSDITVTKAGATNSLTTDADNQLTVNSFDAGETLSVVLDGTTVSITNSSSSGYTQDVAGTAAQLTQAINDANISGVTASVSSGTITLTKSGSVSVSSNANAQTAIGNIDSALEELNTQRAELGAYSNRLDSTVANLTNISTNLEAGRSRIQDADFAAESTNLAKSQILQQASTAMLAQANSSKQSVLSLLQ